MLYFADRLKYRKSGGGWSFLGRLASGSWDGAIRLWDAKTGAEITRLEVDAAVNCLIALPAACLVAGDAIGRLHWLEVVD